MKKIMGLEEFTENVRQYVKNALPEELSEADVHTARLDIWNGNARMILMVTRPHNGVTTGFCLDRHYKNYSSGNATAESVAAAIINDRRLYNIPIAAGNPDSLQDGAVIYA